MESENRAMQRKQSRETERNELLDSATPEAHIHLVFPLTTWAFMYMANAW